MRQPRVLVVTSCTGEKRSKPENQLRLEDFKDSIQLQKREEELVEFACPSGQIYTGQQHLRTMEGVALLRQSLGREAVDVVILSAGYGLIPEDKTIMPYEVTFNTMKGYEVDEWAKYLGIHEAFEKAIAAYDLVFMLLGDNYLRSLNLPIETQPEQTLVFLTSNTSAKYVRGLTAKTFVLPLSNVEAKRYSYGLVGLKGFLFKRFAESVAEKPELLERVYYEPETFETAIERESIQLELPLELPKVEVQVKPSKTLKSKQSSKDEFLPIPDLPPAPNVHLGMHYFIPEWDDHVDPGYDFINDVLTPGRDTYKDEIYAHQIFPTPNYDGILVSKVVVDSNKKKRTHIEEKGIHNFIRFSGPVMGDCGAFGYISDSEPPYTIEEILEYYQKSGFDYGVSIDHLIVGVFAKPGIREKRYELTLKNAEEFLKKHRDGGYQFTPIGVAQGWSPETYAAAVKENISMGYDYVALGGLARAPSKEILEILKAIQPYLTTNTRLHIFGIARLNAIPVFRHLGLTSFDSASPLRRAWFGSRDNYHALSGTTYAAIRIPPVAGHGVRTRQVMEAGIADYETLKQLEQASLKALREFDAGQLGLDETLEILLAYDELLELSRDGKVEPLAVAKRRELHDRMYRKLLEDKPWKACDCPICRNVGVEVIIFRGNDRNRRRGFHNTYVFYKRLKDLLEKGVPAQLTSKSS